MAPPGAGWHPSLGSRIDCFLSSPLPMLPPHIPCPFLQQHLASVSPSRRLLSHCFFSLKAFEVLFQGSRTIPAIFPIPFPLSCSDFWVRLLSQVRTFPSSDKQGLLCFYGAPKKKSPQASRVTYPTVIIIIFQRNFCLKVSLSSSLSNANSTPFLFSWFQRLKPSSHLFIPHVWS